MDDKQYGAELGTIHYRLSQSPVFDWTEFAKHARALLAKPVATREGVHRIILLKLGIQPEWVMDKMVEAGIAALSHFAPPARPRMMIEGMSEEEIDLEMEGDAYVQTVMEGRGISLIEACARVAHRIATTPAPEVDPDAGAIKEFGVYHGSSDPFNARIAFDQLGPTQKDHWRNFASAKKEAGGE